MLEDKFRFWCPIEKSQEINPETGEVVMKLGGIASTSDEDSDGEFLDPKGFDIKPLIEKGTINWHHRSKDQPAAIIGEPSVAEIRPDGLYVESLLYPSSSIAKQVWELAETLEKDSKTRRLGYSIEGKVVKRKSSDKSHPDYKKIEKAIITGVAITHQPKNAKTFANIIKGEIDSQVDADEYDEEESEVDKSTNTESAKPLIKESLNKKIKPSLNKAEAIEIILKNLPNINLNSADKIYDLTQKIATMKKRRNITDEDISKALELLELEEDDKMNKADETETEEEEPQETETEPEEEEEEETTKGKSVKKGNAFGRIEKAIAVSHLTHTKMIKALGVMVKDVSMKAESIISENKELKEIVKAQEETISTLTAKVEKVGAQTPAPRSITSQKVIERTFEKGEESEKINNKNTFSLSTQKSEILEILDQAAFSKGYDDEFGKAVTKFEADKTISRNVASRLKSEYGIEIVK